MKYAPAALIAWIAASAIVGLLVGALRRAGKRRSTR